MNVKRFSTSIQRNPSKLSPQYETPKATCRYLEAQFFSANIAGNYTYCRHHGLLSLPVYLSLYLLILFLLLFIYLFTLEPLDTQVWTNYTIKDIIVITLIIIIIIVLCLKEDKILLGLWLFFSYIFLPFLLINLFNLFLRNAKFRYFIRK